MYALIFQGRVQARGTLERMRQERLATCQFTGREIAWYQIERVS
jgi:hypothetical protein